MRKAMPASILPRLDRIASALLPEHERSDRRVLARARFGCAVIGLLVLLALIRVPMLLANGPRSQAIMLAACALIALGVPVIPRVAGSFAPAAHAIVLLTLLPLLSVIHLTGGSASPALLALILTPMIAVFLTGARGGVVWSLLVGGVVCAYATLDRFGVSPQVLFPADAWKLEKSVGAFLLTMVTLGLALSYERSRQMAEDDAVEASRHADERVAATETTHRASLDWLSQSFAHEANNTLAYVMADLATLGRPATAPRAGGPTGNAARLGAERLRHIVQDVQTIARGVTDPAKDCVAVDVCVLVDAVVAELAPLLRGLDIAIRRAPVTGPIFVRSVPSALARCVASSLIAFAPATEIEVSVERGDRPAVVLTVRSGAFESRPLATEAVRRTLASFGGTLVMSSETARPAMRLELEPAAAPAPRSDALVVETAPKRLRVLVVDDEEVLLKVTAKLLSDLFEVTITSSPHNAIERLRSGGFDVVLCDFNMPEMRGDAVYAAAVAQGFDPAHFIFMSGGGFDELESAMGKRRQHLLSKPYSRKELEGIIRQAGSSRAAGS
jgi:CheY-like chemotaxis protein